MTEEGFLHLDRPANSREIMPTNYPASSERSNLDICAWAADKMLQFAELAIFAKLPPGTEA
jgi:hypothetical protein